MIEFCCVGTRTAADKQQQQLQMGRLCRLEEQTRHQGPPRRHGGGLVCARSVPYLFISDSSRSRFLGHWNTDTGFWDIYVCIAVVEVLENLAYLANASNLVMYLSEYMHLSPSNAANNVTDFMGTAFLLALLGGFLSDALFTTYHIYLISAVIEFLVILLLPLRSTPPP